MLSIPSTVRIFRASEPVDFRKGFDGLCAIVRDHFGDDPLSGHLFLFFNRRRDRIKILVWDQNGFWVLYKRLERGTFAQLATVSTHGQRTEIDRARLQMLLDGIEAPSLWCRKHFAGPMSLGKRPDSGEHKRPPSRRRDRAASVGGRARGAAGRAR